LAAVRIWGSGWWYRACKASRSRVLDPCPSMDRFPHFSQLQLSWQSLQTRQPPQDQQIQKRPKTIFTTSLLSSIQFISTCHVALEGGPCLQGFTRSKSIAQASSSSSGPGS
jgi:hypothetical protein